jgi:hypothetical protein
LGSSLKIFPDKNHPLEFDVFLLFFFIIRTGLSLATWLFPFFSNKRIPARINNILQTGQEIPNVINQRVQ